MDKSDFCLVSSSFISMTEKPCIHSGIELMWSLAMMTKGLQCACTSRLGCSTATQIYHHWFHAAAMKMHGDNHLHQCQMETSSENRLENF